MLLIGIAGGSGSGKTTVVRRIMQMLPPDSVSILSQDNYYRDNGHLSAEERKQINFDHPSSIEFSLMVKQLDDLKAGKTIQMPTYSYLTCARLPETIAIAPRKVIIVEGILIMTDPDLRDRLNIKVFVDADADDRLMRIMRRDLVERGRTNEEVLTQSQRISPVSIRSGRAVPDSQRILPSRVTARTVSLYGVRSIADRRIRSIYSSRSAQCRQPRHPSGVTRISDGA